jgi:pimeloyl-ACP methyl ester carboxylesterase
VKVPLTSNVAPAKAPRFALSELIAPPSGSEAVTTKLLMTRDAEAIYGGIAGNFVKMPKDARFLVDDRLKIIGGPDFTDYCYANSRSVTAMIEGPVRGRLGQIKVPTLIIYGTQDALIPNAVFHGGQARDVGRIGQKEIPGAKLVMLPRAGHMVQWEQSDRYNQEVLSFLAP